MLALPGASEVGGKHLLRARAVRAHGKGGFSIYARLLAAPERAGCDN